MVPQYQFNLGADPILNYNPNTLQSYRENLEQELERLQAIRQMPTNPYNQIKTNLWDEIEKEVSSLTNEQKVLLIKDETYSKIEEQLQMLVQQELFNLVKDKINNSEQGRKILQQQLDTIKSRKSAIIEESNREIELFKKFQIAVQANPNLTYPEFIKNVNSVNV